MQIDKKSYTLRISAPCTKSGKREGSTDIFGVNGDQSGKKLSALCQEWQQIQYISFLSRLPSEYIIIISEKGSSCNR